MDGQRPRASFVPVSQAVAQQLQQRLTDGTFPPDQRLPSQRDLAAMFRVSRPSMREAILMLETLGLLRTEPGRGTFAANASEAAAASADGSRAWARWHPGESGPVEVFQTRLLIEPALAAACARRRDGALAGTLAVLTDAMEAAWTVRDLLTHAAEDYRFHSAIAEGSGNRLLARLYQGAAELIRDTQRVAIPVTGQGRMAQSLTEHRSIITAIGAGDPAAAHRAMTNHVRRTALQSGIEPADLNQLDDGTARGEDG